MSVTVFTTFQKASRVPSSYKHCLLPLDSDSTFLIMGYFFTLYKDTCPYLCKREITCYMPLSCFLCINSFKTPQGPWPGSYSYCLKLTGEGSGAQRAKFPAGFQPGFQHSLFTSTEHAPNYSTTLQLVFLTSSLAEITIQN